MQLQFILYVKDQKKSTQFYTKLLKKKPILLVEGMTEFQLNSKAKLGLMPNDGIARLFPQDISLPTDGTMIPRCELYLKVTNVEKYYAKAVKLGAKAINSPKKRDWGDYVGYVMDFDGHILAFYKKI